MSNFSLFEMYIPERNIIIANHNFYVEQAKKRLLAQFDDLENEVESIAQGIFEQSEDYFDPDYHDPSDFAEAAFEAAQEQLFLLYEMRQHTLFSIIAGIYHQWDKALREWMVKESRLWGNENVTKKIWKVDIGKLFELFTNMGWLINQESFFEKLDACRLIVNVYKHGNGQSLNDLRQKYPQYFYDFENDNFQIDGWFDHSSIQINDEHLTLFSESIINFWQKMPEKFIDSDDLVAPTWLSEALNPKMERTPSMKSKKF